MTESVDYRVVLKDLQRRRQAAAQELSNIDAAIMVIRQMVNGSAVDELRQNVLPGAYANMTTSEAIRTYLSTVGKPQPTRAVADGLEAGGFAHDSKNFYNTVYTAMKREEERGNVFSTEDREWGLSAWRTFEPSGNAD